MIRLRIAVAAVAVLAAGLAVRSVLVGALADASGDTLYTLFVALLAAFLVPSLSPVAAAGIGLAWSVAMEELQAVGVAAQLVALWPPLHYVVGSTFAWVDLVAYLVGAVVAAAVLLALAPRRRAGESEAGPAGRSSGDAPAAG